MEIGISRVHYPITTLGPGKRIGIWLQGCSIHCKGCVSMDTWQFDINRVAMAELKEVLKMWLPQCDGITISGGEPFDQEDALDELLTFLKPFNKSVLLYSGYRFELLKNMQIIKNKRIDALISEPYDHTQPQTRQLLGSDNQKMHFLTALGQKEFADYTYRPQEKKLDIQMDGDTIWMAGIPLNGMQEIANTSNQDGVELYHSQAIIKKRK